MKNGDFRLKIYGVRGSFPPPNGHPTKFGVNTTCIRVDVGPHLILVDAGTGIINAGSDLHSELNSGKSRQNLARVNMFFTHTHIDHLMGLPYFHLLYVPETEIRIISPKFLSVSIRDVIETWMSPAFFPVTLDELGSSIQYHDYVDTQAVYFFEDDFKMVSVDKSAPGKNWIARVTGLRNYTHPKGGTYSYKFENPRGGSIVFATDIEGYVDGDQRLIQFSQDAKILIHDAQYSVEEYLAYQGYGHSTYEMACEVAKKARVQKLVLFHHDPKHTDAELTELERKAREIFPETYIADETMEFAF
jgi:ribonuclease BN (tRNA processing enzyme)